MSIEKHITPTDLRNLIEYDCNTGALTWRARAGNVKHNNRWAGRAALNNAAESGHLRGAILGRVAMAHRVAWAIHYGEWPNGVIDHINGNPADNRITNLRVGTQHQNAMNRRKKIGKTSRYHGVSYCKRDKKYYAYVKHKYKTHYLGCFSDEVDAALARDEKVKELRGEYGVLNFPEVCHGSV